MSPKRQREVTTAAPEYPRGAGGRRRFLRDLGIAATAVVVLPLVGCELEEDLQGTPPMPDGWGTRDRGVDGGADLGKPDVTMGGIVDAMPADLDREGGVQKDVGEKDGGQGDAASEDATAEAGAKP